MRRIRTGVLGAALLVGAAAVPAQAQDGAAQRMDEAIQAQPGPWQPVVFAYGLTRAGEAVLDPFGSDGRREVVQLMADRNLWQGRFVRSRMETGPDGLSVRRDEGWYEIRGDNIVFYHADAAGATGRVEVAGYQSGRICGTDPVSGAVLSYDLIVDENDATTAPPPAATPAGAACGVPGASGAVSGS